LSPERFVANHGTIRGLVDAHRLRGRPENIHCLGCAWLASHLREKKRSRSKPFSSGARYIVETWRREAVQEGVEQGIKQGLMEVYEARLGAMSEDFRAVVEDTDHEPTLITWLRLAGTRSVDEIAAAIRSFRAS